jgi:hypothetical protein
MQWSAPEDLMRKAERAPGFAVRTNISDMTLIQYHTPVIRFVKRKILVWQASDEAASSFRKAKQTGIVTTEQGFNILLYAKVTLFQPRMDYRLSKVKVFVILGKGGTSAYDMPRLALYRPLPVIHDVHNVWSFNSTEKQPNN